MDEQKLENSLADNRQSIYPGINNPYLNQNAIVPFNQTTVLPPAAPASASPFAAITNMIPGLKNFNISDMKGFIDKMGGIDGIVSMINKAHKTMQSVQQMVPMIKLLAGSFGKKGGSGASHAASDVVYRPRNRPRKRRAASNKRRPVRRRTR